MEGFLRRWKQGVQEQHSWLGQGATCKKHGNGILANPSAGGDSFTQSKRAR